MARNLTSAFKTASEAKLTHPATFAEIYPRAWILNGFNGTAKITNRRLQLCDGVDHSLANGQAISAFWSIPKDIQTFACTFEFVSNGGFPSGDGITICFQSDSPSAVGLGGADLGYGHGTNGILKSVAITFRWYLTDGYSGLRTNAGGTISDNPTSPVVLWGGHRIQVILAYDGTTLSWTINDLDASTTYSDSAAVDIPTLVGSTKAWIGLTGGDGTAQSVQQIISFKYNSTTVPADTIDNSDGFTGGLTIYETLYLWNGLGPIDWNGHTWLGMGKFGDLSPIIENTDLSVTGVKLSLSGIPSDLVSIALDTLSQADIATLWFGYLDDSGAVIVDPFAAFSGQVDTVEVEDTGATSTITISVESDLIVHHKPQGTRYTDADQKAKYPTDRGFEYVDKIQETNISMGIAGRVPIQPALNGE